MADDIIDFGMGNPDQKTPEHIINKMQECVDKDSVHRYSTSKEYQDSERQYQIGMKINLM